jgi:cytochrome c oxidase subunit 3
MENTETKENQTFTHPNKFMLWLFIVTIVMIFAALTSAYLVRSSDGDWLKFPFPKAFTISTIVLIISSVTMQLAYINTKKNQTRLVQLFLGITMLLAMAFSYLQVEGWGQLIDFGVWFGGKSSNPAGSFVYVFSGLHLFHLFTGIIYLAYVLISSFKGKIDAQNTLSIELCTTYWHFLDLLWVYLFVFLQMNS